MYPGPVRRGLCLGVLVSVCIANTFVTNYKRTSQRTVSSSSVLNDMLSWGPMSRFAVSRSCVRRSLPRCAFFLPMYQSFSQLFTNWPHSAPCVQALC